jgi:hypothetical protein
MKKFTSILKNSYKMVIAVSSILVVATALLIWGVIAYKKNSEIQKFGMEKIEVVNVTAAQGFILDKNNWLDVPDAKGYDFMELVEAKTPFKKVFSNGYTIYINQVGAISVLSPNGEALGFDLVSIVQNYFEKRNSQESFNNVFDFKQGEMDLVVGGDFRVKIYPRYLSFVIGRDKSSPEMPIKFLNGFSFYILIGK